MNNWQTRAGRGAVADFRKLYDWYFKWLAGKVMSLFIITDEDPSERTASIDWDYFKLNLILNGQICITDFNDKLYACIGNRGGAPNEYYLPSRFIIANPILGSKEVQIGKDGVVIYNTKIDKYVWTGSGPIFASGLCDYIAQTATILADNIISINCVQVNTRVSTFFTADSESQALEGEATLKKMYAGCPYLILKSDILEKLNVNPVNAAAASQNITELIELNNFVISSFFQNIGIRANNNMKRERLVTDEVEAQNDYLEINVLEFLAPWQDGLDEVNKMYNTSLKVHLNPVLLNELLNECEGTSAAAEPEEEAAAATGEPEGADPEQEEPMAKDPEAAEPEQEEEAAADGEPEGAEPEEDLSKEIESMEEQVTELIDIINDNNEGKEEEENESESGEEAAASDID